MSSSNQTENNFKYVCDICGNYATNHAGGFNLHVKRCRDKRDAEEFRRNNNQRQTGNEGNRGANQTTRKKETQTGRDDNDCLHAFRPLRPNIPQEYQAMIEGYREVCSKCQGVQ